MAKKDEQGVTIDETDSMADVEPGQRAERPISKGQFGTRAVQERLAPGTDPTTVKPLRRKELGIKNDEKLLWVRNPDYYNGEDRIHDNLEDRDGSRVIMGKDGKPYRRQDCVLMAYPEKVFEQEEAGRQQAAKRYVEEIDESAALIRLLGGDEDGPTFNELTTTRAKLYAQQRHLDAVAKGMIGGNSPTAGLSYEKALSLYSDEQIRAEEDRYRRQGRREDFGQNDWERMMGGAKVGGGRGTTMAVGNATSKPNPNSALEQAKRRAARESGTVADSQPRRGG